MFRKFFSWFDRRDELRPSSSSSSVSSTDSNSTGSESLAESPANPELVCDIGLSTAVPSHSQAEPYGTEAAPRCHTSNIDQATPIMNQLGLREYFPRKLTLQDMHLHRGRTLQSANDIPWVMLERLFTLDYKARDREVHTINKMQTQQSKKLKRSLSQTLALRRDTSGNRSRTCDLHPEDVLCLIVACCDLQFLQTFFQKLFMCRLAIPVIIPSKQPLQFLFWSLRGIMLDYCTGDNQSIDIRAVKAEVDIISALRIGSLSQSKSKILNGLIGSKNNTFYNRECPSGRCNRRLAKGLVETAWHLPSQQSSFVPKMIFNLRGDSFEAQKQAELLSRMARTAIIMTSYGNLIESSVSDYFRNILSYSKEIVLVIMTNDEDPDEIEANASKVDAMTKEFAHKIKCIVAIDPDTFENTNIHELIEELREHIYCTNQFPPKSLESIILGERTFGPALDEDDADLSNARTHFEVIQTFLSSREARNSSDIKNMMPLQGQLNMEWAKLYRRFNKTCAKDGIQTTERELADMEEGMLGIRKGQIDLYNDQSDFIKQIIVNNPNEHDLAILSITCNYLKMFLNDKSMTEMPQLRKTYHSIWHESKDGKAVSSDVQKKLRDAEKALLHGSLGLEHVFREMSLVFEAFHACRRSVEMPPEVQYLPELTTSLILAGFPLEIMDGETSCVPIDWLKAVFRQLSSKLDGSAVFIVSTLGLQSSGKSTLLNAMFGLEFAVSSGRCTRGVFAQLFRVNENQYPFQYVLVLDTEGLRAPELAMYNYEHDNELATFVLGLADLAIINFKGETVGEMRDVLQTAVHAFIKIRLANKCKDLQQKCIFTHQNVSQVSAREKTEYSQDNLLDQLDEMTKVAAELESDYNTTLFKEVIAIDQQNQTWMFPDLYEGEPPNAAINPGYSENIVQVRNAILSGASGNSQKTIEDIFYRISDLWKAISSMDFVFSFRNTLEAKGYDMLEQTYCSIKWSSDATISNWYNTQAVPQMRGSTTSNQVNVVYNELVSDLNSKTNEETIIAVGKLQAFIKDSTEASILGQWESGKTKSLEKTISDIHDRYKHKIKGDKQLQMVEVKYNHDGSICLHKLNSKASEIAKQTKYRDIDDSQLDPLFNTIWKQMLQEMDIQQIEINNTADIEDTFHHILKEELLKQSGLLRAELRKCPLHVAIKETELKTSFQLEDMNVSYLNLVEVKTNVLKRLTKNNDPTIDTCLKLAHSEVSKILTRVDLLIGNLLKEASDFEEKFAREIVKLLLCSLDEFNKTRPPECHFTFRPIFHVVLACHVSRFAIRAMNSKKNYFDEKHGLKHKISCWRETTKQLFMNTVHNKSQDIIAADLITSTLKNELRHSTERKLPDEVARRISDIFVNRKFHLLTHILDELIEEDDFTLLSEYADDTVQYTKSWLKSYTNHHMFNEEHDCDTRYARLAKTMLAQDIGVLKESIQKATEYVMTTPLTDKQKHWVNHVEANLNKRVPCKEALKCAADANITDYLHFKDVLLDNIDTIEKDLRSTFRAETGDSVKWVGTLPSEQAFMSMWGCTERCPFCREPCADSDPHHYSPDTQVTPHKSMQHRPRCTMGGYWKGTTTMVWHYCPYMVFTSCGFLCNPLCVFKGTCEAVHEDTYHSYRDYKHIFPSWDIEPSNTADAAIYWCWITSHYRSQFENKYKMSLKDMPKSWTKYNKSDAKESLREAYKL